MWTSKFICLAYFKKRKMIEEKKHWEVKDLLWKHFVDFKAMKPGKNYRFGHFITTDGVSASVHFVLKDIDRQKKRKINKVRL